MTTTSRPAALPSEATATEWAGYVTPLAKEAAREFCTLTKQEDSTQERLEQIIQRAITKAQAGVMAESIILLAARRIAARDGQGSEQRHAYQVLAFEPQLTHSVWKDWFCDGHPTEEEILGMLRAGVEAGEYVGWRVITIHQDVLGRDATALAKLKALTGGGQP